MKKYQHLFLSHKCLPHIQQNQKNNNQIFKFTFNVTALLYSVWNAPSLLNKEWGIVLTYSNIAGNLAAALPHFSLTRITLSCWSHRTKWNLQYSNLTGWGGKSKRKKGGCKTECKANRFLVNNFPPDTLTRIFTKAWSLEMEMQLLGASYT